MCVQEKLLSLVKQTTGPYELPRRKPRNDQAMRITPERSPLAESGKCKLPRVRVAVVNYLTDRTNSLECAIHKKAFTIYDSRFTIHE